MEHLRGGVRKEDSEEDDSVRRSDRGLVVPRSSVTPGLGDYDMIPECGPSRLRASERAAARRRWAPHPDRRLCLEQGDHPRGGEAWSTSRAAARGVAARSHPGAPYPLGVARPAAVVAVLAGAVSRRNRARARPADRRRTRRSCMARRPAGPAVERRVPLQHRPCPRSHPLAAWIVLRRTPGVARGAVDCSRGRRRAEWEKAAVEVCPVVRRPPERAPVSATAGLSGLQRPRNSSNRMYHTTGRGASRRAGRFWSSALLALKLTGTGLGGFITWGGARGSMRSVGGTTRAFSKAPRGVASRSSAALSKSSRRGTRGMAVGARRRLTRKAGEEGHRR